MKTNIQNKIFLFSLVLISMWFSAIPAVADIAPPPLSYIEVFINKKGHIVIPSPKQIKAYSPKRYYPQVQSLYLKDSNLKPIYIAETGYGFSDENGKVIIKPQFDMIQSFGEGLAAVRKNKKWGFINEKGVLIIPLEFPSVMCYQYNENGEYFPVHKCCSSSVFSEGLAPIPYEEYSKVSYGGNYYDPVFPKGKDDIIGCVEGYVKNGKFLIKRALDPNEAFALSINNYGHIILKYKYGYIDKTGKVVIKGDFNEPRPFSEGLAAARNEYYQWGYIDKTGKFVIKPQFDQADAFSGGIARVRIPAYRIIFSFSAILLVLIIITSISIKKGNQKEIDDKSEHN